LLLPVFLSGCIKADIDTGIDMDLTAYLSYRISLDVSMFETRYQDVLMRALNNIGWHYQEELGFTVEMHTESDPYVLLMTRKVKNDSLEQAYKSLENMLTNEEMTLFMKVDLAFENSSRQSRYIFNAATDIRQIIRLSNAEELPPDLQDDLAEAIATGEGTITVSLPTGELISSTHRAEIQHDQAVMVVPLTFTEPVEFEIAGVTNLLRDGTPGGSLDEILRELYMYRNLSIIAGCALIIVILITALIIKLTKKKIN